jgi:hypothetical protein
VFCLSDVGALLETDHLWVVRGKEGGNLFLVDGVRVLIYWGRCCCDGGFGDCIRI